VHDDAEKIEHILGDDVVRELERMLDDTTRDPHGRAIPGFVDIHKPFAPSASGPSGYGRNL
jgi:manganese/zinc/iron transport system permease protein